MREIAKRDTFILQVGSLREVMGALGYSMVETSKGLAFVCNIDEHKHHPIISLSNAVSLHNHQLEYLGCSIRQRSQFYFEPYFVRRAVAAKIVETVGLHLEGGLLTTNKHWVKFCNDSYNLFAKILPTLPAVEEGV